MLPSCRVSPSPRGPCPRWSAARVSRVVMTAQPLWFERLVPVWGALLTAPISIAGTVIANIVLDRKRKPRPDRVMEAAVLQAGRKLVSETKKSTFVAARPREEAIIREFLDAPGPTIKDGCAFFVVSGEQGIGKSSFLESLLAQYIEEGRWVVPVEVILSPGEKLDIPGAVLKTLRLKKFPANYPQRLQDILEDLKKMSMSKTKSHSPVIYLQLSTRSRADRFTYNQCDEIAATVGAYLRLVTYDHPLCKLILEVSVSLVADLIVTKFEMSRLLVVQPLPFDDWVDVLKRDKKELVAKLRTLVTDDSQMMAVLKYFHVRFGGAFRALENNLEDAATGSSMDQSGYDTIIEVIDNIYKSKVKPIEPLLVSPPLCDTILGKASTKDFLAKVAEAGPLGYRCKTEEEISLEMTLLRAEPSQSVLRMTSPSRVTLKHRYFALRVLGS